MKNIKEGDIIVEVVQNVAMTRIEVYRINSIMSGEIEYGEEAKDSWAINAEYKDFVKGLTSWHREFNNCLIDCRKFEKDEQGPDFIRELRSKWYFEKDRPVYFVRRKEDNKEFFDKIQNVEDIFPSVEII